MFLITQKCIYWTCLFQCAAMRVSWGAGMSQSLVQPHPLMSTSSQSISFSWESREQKAHSSDWMKWCGSDHCRWSEVGSWNTFMHRARRSNSLENKPPVFHDALFGGKSPSTSRQYLRTGMSDVYSSSCA